MADDRTWRRVEIGADFEVQYVAEKFGIRMEQARRLIARFGNDRGALERAARLLKKACSASQGGASAADGSLCTE